MEDRVRENEAVKMIRVKASLLKLSESYLELANKCKVIFEAYSDVAQQLPDVQDEDLQDIRYTGNGKLNKFNGSQWYHRRTTTASCYFSRL